MSFLRSLIGGRLSDAMAAAISSWNHAKMRRRAINSWEKNHIRHRRVRRQQKKPQRGPVVILKGSTNQQRIRSARGR